VFKIICGMPSLWLVSIASCLLYFVVLAVYRLYLSPIAYFPGSKITTISGWYETYLDVFKGGQFTFQIQKWHEKYGEGSTSLQSATSSAHTLCIQGQSSASTQQRSTSPIQTSTIPHTHRVPLSTRFPLLEIALVSQQQSCRPSTTSSTAIAGRP
jgi:hypothetical protein